MVTAPDWSFWLEAITIVPKLSSATTSVQHSSRITTNASAYFSLNLICLIVGPEASVDAIVKATGATTVGDYYVLPSCNSTQVLPTLLFHAGGGAEDAGGGAIEITPYDYVVEHPVQKGACVIAFLGDKKLDHWVLGSRFVNSHCVSADYDKKTLGFAKAHNE